jgi:hypothetical protein
VPVTQPTPPAPGTIPAPAPATSGATSSTPGGSQR